MTISPVHRRGAIARSVGVLVASTVAGVGITAFAATASAEEAAPLPTVEVLDIELFSEEAAKLPSDLIEAIERDLGISPAEYLANAASAKRSTEVVDALETAGVAVEASAVDGQQLTVYVENENDVAQVEATGAVAEVGRPEVDTSQLAKPKLYPHEDFRGGYGHSVEGPKGLYWCSAGFTGTNATGDPLIVTAGHCGADLAAGTPWHWLDLDQPIYDTQTWLDEWDANPLGETGPMHFSGDGNDAGLISVTEGGWDLLPQVANWGGGDGAPDAGQAVNVYDSVDAIVGQPACKSGATSGWKCGKVLYAEDTVELSTGDDVTGFIFTACMLGGDSGGSIVSGNYALGIDSYSTDDVMDSCAGWEPATTYEQGGFADGDISGGFAITSGSANIEKVFADDFNLSIHVGEPVVTAPEDGAVVGQTPTIKGTVQAAAGSTVTVEVEDGPTVEGTVGADGSWSAKVSERLEPGEYDYTATASHTAKGGLEATTSESVSGTFEVVEQQVADLIVDGPGNGQTTSDARPPFSGTGQPGATVALTAGNKDFGQAQVGDDGAWSITPDADLPVGVRFDAVVTQTFQDDTQQVTVTGLGINAPDVTITAPEDGATVPGDVTFTGTSFAGATVELELASAADGNDAETARALRDHADVEPNGDWTFTPDEPLAEGAYLLSVTATREGGDPQLSTSQTHVMFTVDHDAPGDGGDDNGDDNGGGNGDEELPDTGSSGTTWLIVAGIALLVIGGLAVALRARRGAGSAEETTGDAPDDGNSTT